MYTQVKKFKLSGYWKNIAPHLFPATIYSKILKILPLKLIVTLNVFFKIEVIADINCSKGRQLFYRFRKLQSVFALTLRRKRTPKTTCQFYKGVKVKPKHTNCHIIITHTFPLHTKTSCNALVDVGEPKNKMAAYTWTHTRTMVLTHNILFVCLRLNFDTWKLTGVFSRWCCGRL